MRRAGEWRRFGAASALAVLALALVGCGASQRVVTLTKTVTNTVTAPAAGTKRHGESPRSHRKRARPRTSVTSSQPAQSTATSTTSAKAKTTRPIASAPAPSSTLGFRQAVAALARDCRRLPPVASIPLVRGTKIKGRTLALILLPRAYPLQSLLDRVAATYSGSALLKARIETLRRASERVLEGLERALADTAPIRTTSLGHAIAALSRISAHFSLPECSV